MEQRLVRFDGGAEPVHADYFVAGSGQSILATAPAAAQRPRIVSPVPGTVYALGAVAHEHLRLDDRDIGLAATSPLVLPGPSAHRAIARHAEWPVLQRNDRFPPRQMI